MRMALSAKWRSPRRVDGRPARRSGAATPGDQRAISAGDFTTRLSGANVRFEGNLLRDGRFWLAEIPLLDAMTQGRTRAEALNMISDWLETMVNRPDFRAEVYPRGKYE